MKNKIWISLLIGILISVLVACTPQNSLSGVWTAELENGGAQLEISEKEGQFSILLRLYQPAEERLLFGELTGSLDQANGAMVFRLKGELGEKTVSRIEGSITLEKDYLKLTYQSVNVSQDYAFEESTQSVRLLATDESIPLPQNFQRDLGKENLPLFPEEISLPFGERIAPEESDQIFGTPISTEEEGKTISKTYPEVKLTLMTPGFSSNGAYQLLFCESRVADKCPGVRGITLGASIQEVLSQFLCQTENPVGLEQEPVYLYGEAGWRDYGLLEIQNGQTVIRYCADGKEIAYHFNDNDKVEKISYSWQDANLEKRIFDMSQLENYPGLTAAVCQKLGKTDGSVSRNDLLSLTELQVEYRSFSDPGLEPLAECQNLKKLEIYGMNSEMGVDLTPLSYLTNLDFLRITGVNLDDLLPLGELTELHKLELSSSWTLSDLSPLSRLSNLEELNLSGNRISDLKPLERLTHLKKLDLTDNQLFDLEPLRQLNELTMLNISDNRISDLAPLSNLPQLKEAFLGFNQIQDISIVSNWECLERLRLEYNQIEDLSPLAELGALRELSITGNPVADLSPVSHIDCVENN